MSFDGQYYRISVRDEHGKPLTVLQLAKDTWDKAKRTPKSKQIDVSDVSMES